LDGIIIRIPYSPTDQEDKYRKILFVITNINNGNPCVFIDDSWVLLKDLTPKTLKSELKKRGQDTTGSLETLRNRLGSLLQINNTQDNGQLTDGSPKNIRSFKNLFAGETIVSWIGMSGLDEMKSRKRKASEITKEGKKRKVKIEKIIKKRIEEVEEDDKKEEGDDKKEEGDEKEEGEDIIVEDDKKEEGMR